MLPIVAPSSKAMSSKFGASLINETLTDSLVEARSVNVEGNAGVVDVTMPPYALFTPPLK